MAIKDSVLNIVIKAKDLAKGTLDRFREGLRSTEQQAERTESKMATLAKRVVGLVAAYASFSAVTRAVGAILGTGDKFEKLSIQMAAVMGSLEAGEQATAWIKQFTRDTPLQLEDTITAFTRLKNFGIDPMDGSLQAIADQTAKLGGSQEVLIGITNALGQAYAKQKLQGEEILQLVERGVPVWDLLAEATGKTTLELQDMSSAGELGRDVIDKLIAAMGASATGAAAANMGTLSGIVSNLKDRFQEFLNTIAQSGTLDFFKGELDKLGNTVTRLANDGTLLRWAQSLSNGIVGVASSIRASVKFIAEYSAEIALLAKAFVAIQFAKAIQGTISFGVEAVKAAASTKIFSRATDGAAASIGRLQGAFLGLQAFLVGWQIGDYLRKEFVAVERFSYALVGGLMKSWERLRFGWDAIKAAFTDDTLADAQERLSQRLKQIDLDTAILMDTAGQAGEAFGDLGDSAAAAAADVANVVTTTTDAIETTAAAAREAVSASLEKLGVDITKVTTGISKVGTEAIDEFGKVAKALKDTGADAEESGKIISAAYLAAFEKIETEAGRTQLLAGLNEQLRAGVITAFEYNDVLAKTGQTAEADTDKIRLLREEIERLRREMQEGGDDGEQLGDGIQEGTRDATAGVAILSAALSAYTQQMANLSQGALQAWQSIALGMKPAAEETDALTARINTLSEGLVELERQSFRVADSTGLQRGLRDMKIAANEVEIAFIEQTQAARGLVDQYNQNTLAADVYISRARSMLNFGNLLNDQDMSTLTEGIQRAEQAMASLRDQTADTLGDLQTELDRLEGRTDAIREREYQQRLNDLQAQLATARGTGDREAIANAQESLRIAERIYAVEKANREEADRERKKQAAESAQKTQTRETTQRAEPAADRQNTGTRTIRLEAGGRTAEVSTTNPDQLLDLLAAAGLRTG